MLAYEHDKKIYIAAKQSMTWAFILAVSTEQYLTNCELQNVNYIFPAVQEIHTLVCESIM